MNEANAPAPVDRLGTPAMAIRQYDEGVEVTCDGVVSAGRA
jgi:hypothetical protein